MMPATAGPRFIPRRNWSLPRPNPASVTSSRMPSAMRASACAWLGPRDRNPARHHVVGADGADLLAAVLGGETVEAREDVAEQRHHRLGSSFCDIGVNPTTSAKSTLIPE